ncbi:MAG: hypothetical protein LH702_36195 [Phormidesmis sp. CAN_BIN44]|nr:hypothetical protein [Phormidesmis sp. CAN_BIN44]
MTTLPKGFDYQGIYYYPSQTDPSSFYYIPAVPVPQRTSQGDPAVSLMVLDQFAMLQLSSEWTVTSEQLDALQKNIAEQFDREPEAVQLQLAPLTVDDVTLSLKTEQGDFEVLKTTHSSGYLPFSAVFSVDLSDEQKAQAIAAFNDRKDQLIVTYKAALDIEISAKVTIAGNIQTDLQKLPKKSVLKDCLAQIETAIAHKQLRLEHTASPKASGELCQKTEQLAKERAAELLLSMAQGVPVVYDRSDFQASATLTESLPVGVERSADISTWFPTGRGLDYMQLIGV